MGWCMVHPLLERPTPLAARRGFSFCVSLPRRLPASHRSSSASLLITSVAPGALAPRGLATASRLHGRAAETGRATRHEAPRRDLLRRRGRRADPLPRALRLLSREADAPRDDEQDGEGSP